MDKVKVNAILKQPYATKVKEVQQSLGFCNYYHRYIKDFANIAKPLYQLTEKNWEWQQTSTHAKAWDKLKEAFKISDFLQIPDYNKPWQIEPDGSGFAIGGVLSQKDQKGKWHPVAFLSKGMSPAKQNYDIYNRELLAMICWLEEWRYYILRSLHTIEIWSDHLNLIWFKQPPELKLPTSPLDDVSTTIRHQSSTQTQEIDGCSRCALTASRTQSRKRRQSEHDCSSRKYV